MSQICLKQARIAEKLSEGVKKIIDIESLSRLLLEMSSEFDEASDRFDELEAKLAAIAKLPRFSPRDSERGGVKMIRCDDGVFIQHFSVEAIIKGE